MKLIKNNKKIAIFFNSMRGISVFKKISQKYYTDVYVALKNLNNATRLYLKKKKISYTLIKKIDSSLIKKIKKKNYDILISAGFPLIFPNKLIEASSLSTINLHAGKLPSYRGGSPLNWQIINGEKEIEINIIKMEEKIDHGKIYLSKKFKLLKDGNIKTVHKKTNILFPKMTLQVIEMIYKNIKPVSQKSESNRRPKTYKQRSEGDGLIKWNNLSANEVYNFVRAITKPYPGAFYYDKNKNKKRLYSCKLSSKNPNILPGTEFFMKKKKFIKCKKYSIQLLS